MSPLKLSEKEYIKSANIFLLYIWSDLTSILWCQFCFVIDVQIHCSDQTQIY